MKCCLAKDTRFEIKKVVQPPFFGTILNNACPDILFRPAMTHMTVREYDVISVVHISSYVGNHFTILFRNLHCVQHSALVLSNQILNVGIDRHSPVGYKAFDDVFHDSRNNKADSLIMLFIKLICIPLYS